VSFIACYKAGMKKIHGFTIIELLVTMVVLAIVAAVAVPSFNSMVTNNRLAGEINDLVATINFARSEAITRGVSVVVCKSADGAACTNAGDWSQGWIIFTDTDNNQSVDAGAGDVVIRAIAGYSGTDAMTGSGNSANWVSFNRNGFAPLNNANILKLCDADADFEPRALQFNTTGRVEFYKDASVAPLNQACP
jgi:type IV fimbrial biogenesis protein FimT